MLCRNLYFLGSAFHVLKMFTFCCLTISLCIQWILTFFTPNFLLNPSFFCWILSSSQQDSILLTCPFSVCDPSSSFISVVHINIGGRPFNWELTMSEESDSLKPTIINYYGPQGRARILEPCLSYNEMLTESILFRSSSATRTRVS